MIWEGFTLAGRDWGVLLRKHSQSASEMDGIQRGSQSSFVFFLSGQEADLLCQ